MTGKDPLAGFEATIRGCVQGVGFRYHTQRFAKELGVTGWVRNQTDGSVRVNARGRLAELDAFISFLKVGPSYASVDGVDIEWRDEREEWHDFRVVR